MSAMRLLLAVTLSLGVVFPSQAADRGHRPPVRRTDLRGDPLPPGALARMGTARFRHADAIRFLAFAAGGKRILSAGKDSTIRLWDAASGRNLWIVEQAYPRALAVSPDGKTLAVHEGHELVLRAVTTGKPFRRIVPNPGALRAQPVFSCLAFSPDGKILAMGEYDETLSLWDVATGRRLSRAAGRPGCVICQLAFTHDGKKLLLHCTEGPRRQRPAQLRLRDLATAKEKVLPVPLSSQDGQFAFSPDDKTLVYARLCPDDGKKPRHTRRNQIVLLDLAAAWHRVLAVLPASFAVRDLSFTPDGKRLLSLERDALVRSIVRAREVATGKELYRVQERFESDLCMALSGDGKRLITAGYSGVIRLRDAANGKELVPDEMPALAANAAAFTPDGRTLVTTFAGKVCLWRASTGQLLHPSVAVLGTAAALSPDGKLLAAGGTVPRVTLSEPTTGRPVHYLDGHDDPVLLLAFTPDGKTLLAADEKKLRHWDVATGKLRNAFPVPGAQLEKVAFSPGSMTFAALGSDPDKMGPSELHLLDARSGEDLGRVPQIPKRVDALALSPDGWLLAVSGREEREEVWVIDTVTGQAMFRRQAPLRASTLAFSPDGRLLALGVSAAAGGWRDGKLRLWDVLTGAEVGAVESGGGIRSLAFSPDGKRLASGLDEGGVLVWDVGALRKDTVKLPDPMRAPDELQSGWRDLAALGGDTSAIAIRRLAAGGTPALKFLSERLRPAPEPDRKRFRRLLADLADEKPPVREAASKELERAADTWEPLMREALKEGQPPAIRRRLEALVKEPWYTRSPEVLRRVRGVQVLESVGSRDARSALERLAEGWPGARETRYAKSALRRLGRRHANRVIDSGKSERPRPAP